LNAIGSEVGEVHAQTTEITKTLQQQEIEAAQSKKDEERRRLTLEEKARQSEVDSENDPLMFARANISGTTGGGLQVYIDSPRTLSLPFSEPTLRIAFREGTAKALLTIVTERRIFAIRRALGTSGN